MLRLHLLQLSEKSSYPEWQIGKSFEAYRSLYHNAFYHTHIANQLDAELHRRQWPIFHCRLRVEWNLQFKSFGRSVRLHGELSRPILERPVEARKIMLLLRRIKSLN